MTIKVCVTGATGFIASHIIHILLEKGYYVNATVRSNSSPKAEYLFEYMEKYKDSDGKSLLNVYKADLMVDNSFDLAFEGCDYVIHVASPVKLTSSDPINEIITPAIEGTKKILQACTKAKTVKRLILTSSVSAVYNRNDLRNVVYTEDDWHTDEDIYNDPYPYAKTQAEKTAWKYVEDNPDGFDLVTIHPSMTIGPILNGYVSESNSTILSLFNSQYPLIPNINFCFVDVRDVAMAHVLAMENPSSKGRYIVSNKNMWYPEAAKLIHDIFNDRSISYRRSPNFLVYFFALFDRRVSFSFLSRSLDIEKKYSNEKVQKELGLKFRPIEETIVDACNSFIKFGLDKNSKSKSGHFNMIITLAIIAGIGGSSLYAYRRWFKR